MGKRFLALAIVVAIAITAPFTAFAGDNNTLSGIKNAVEGVISYKCEQENAESFSELLDKLSAYAGTYSSDWYYIAFSRYGLDCDNKKSIDALKNKVNEFYSKELADVKVTDMQRVALALSSCGVDITDVCGHNLLADATYNRASVKPLNSQGINSVAYALLLLDYKNYTVPDSALTTREKMVELILKSELENGGFALFGNYPDVDITSIAVQALAPYKDRENVRPALDKCVSILSAGQDSTGGYKSFSNEISCESTAQVVLGLTAAGINPMTDSRFIKNGNSVLDGLMTFRLDNGSFSHFKDGKPDNMATYQALCALVGAYRCLNGENTFYKISDKEKKTVVKIRDINKAKDEKSRPKKKSEKITASSSSNTSKIKDNKASVSSAENPTDKVEFVTKPDSSEMTTKEKTTQTETVGESWITSDNNSVKENKSCKTDDRQPAPQYICFGAMTLAYAVLALIKRRKK